MWYGMGMTHFSLSTSFPQPGALQLCDIYFHISESKKAKYLVRETRTCEVGAKLSIKINPWMHPSACCACPSPFLVIAIIGTDEVSQSYEEGFEGPTSGFLLRRERFQVQKDNFGDQLLGINAKCSNTNSMGITEFPKKMKIFNFLRQ